MIYMVIVSEVLFSQTFNVQIYNFFGHNISPTLFRVERNVEELRVESGLF